MELSYDASGESAAGVERCQELFEDFCIVTESVRHGIPVQVHIERRHGADLVVESETS